MTDEVYEEEALKIFANLQAENAEEGFHGLDAVWEDPVSKAKIYVGGAAAARDYALLQSKNITRIVNCRGDKCANALEGQENMKFFRISVINWMLESASKSSANAREIWNFYREYFLWMDDALANGESVLVHCLAGAHRAPTTAACYLLYKTHFDVPQITKHVKLCRPIVDFNFSGTATVLVILYTALNYLKFPNTSQVFLPDQETTESQ